MVSFRQQQVIAEISWGADFGDAQTMSNDARLFQISKPLGRGQINKAIAVLARKVERASAGIDQIIATIDPEAGGAFYIAAELYRLIGVRLGVRYPIDLLLVRGRHGQKREVERLPDVKRDVRTVLLVGDASFSGNTRQITKQALQSRYPRLRILTATITTGEKKPDFYVYEIDEREVYFPWGSVDSTGECGTPLRLRRAPETIRFGYRVWGNYEEFALNLSCTARMLTVLPQQRLSLQMHFRRDELFAVLDSGACFEYGHIYRNGDRLTLNELRELVRNTEAGGKRIILTRRDRYRPVRRCPKVGEYVLIPRGTLHRLMAGKNSVRVVEISFGHYDQITDIARMKDDYGRENLSGRY